MAFRQVGCQPKQSSQTEFRQTIEAGSPNRRVVFHVDMDAFFVSVEELFRPDLRGKAVIVGGDPDQRGVVSTASYEARKFGVHSAMPLATAKSLCPHAIFLPGRRDCYLEYSKRVRSIFCGYVPRVEMVSIDEAYLDFTGSERLYGDPFSLAHRLRREIEDQTGLSASIGVSTSKLVSKVASDLAKPRGILQVLPGHESAFLAPLKIGRIPGIGKATQQRLNELGVTKVADLTAVGRLFLNETFGLWGEALYRKALGQETAHFEFREEPRSISQEHTFIHDTNNNDQVQRTLAYLVQRVAHRLRGHRLYAKTITLKLRDSDFLTQTRASSLREPTQLDAEILDAVIHSLRQNWNGQSNIRLLGVGLSALTYGPLQEDLFRKEQRDRLTKLYRAADQVREKFGFGSILSARTLSGNEESERPGRLSPEEPAAPDFCRGSWHDG